MQLLMLMFGMKIKTLMKDFSQNLENIYPLDHKVV